MKNVRITVIRKVCHKDLMKRYENPIEHACDLHEGQVFVSDGMQRPEGLCPSAWQTLSPFVMALAHGATDFYDGWMRNPASAMLSCNVSATFSAATIRYPTEPSRNSTSAMLTVDTI